MTAPARKWATYEDVLASPSHVVAEVIEGVLHQSPRPAARHARAAGSLYGEVYGAYERGRGGPGGWVILPEPELHFRRDIVVPDLAGWRRERMPIVPDVAFFELAPDWVCEVASPSTRALDRGAKLDVYLRERVPHVWLVEPNDQFLEVLELDGESYRLAQRASGDERKRLRPFDAFEFEVGVLWAL